MNRTDGTETYRVSDDLCWVDASELADPVGVGADDPIAWLCTTADPTPHELRDWAWLIWQYAVDGGTAAQIEAALTADHPLPNDGTVEVADFLSQLADRGFLVCTRDATVG